MVAVTLGLAVLYGTKGAFSNAAGEDNCAPARTIASAMRPLARGEVAAVQVAKEPRPVPALSFNGADGKPMTLADFKGKTVLLNLWATWCVPCRQEMPALDGLQAKLGGDDFQVVAINIDTRNLDKPKAWLAMPELPASPITPTRRQDLPGAEARRARRSACRRPC